LLPLAEALSWPLSDANGPVNLGIRHEQVLVLAIGGVFHDVQILRCRYVGDGGSENPWVLFWVLFASKSFEMAQNSCKWLQRFEVIFLCRIKEI